MISSFSKIYASFNVVPFASLIFHSAISKLSFFVIFSLALSLASFQVEFLFTLNVLGVLTVRPSSHVTVIVI